MVKFAAAIALSALTLALSVPAYAAARESDNRAASGQISAGPSAQTQPNHGRNAQAKNGGDSHTSKAVLGHTWDDQTEETAKMPGTTGPRNTPKGGAGLSYPSTQ